MKYWELKERGIVFVSLHHGDDVLALLTTLIREADLQNAVLMTGLGSSPRATSTSSPATTIRRGTSTSS